MLLKSMQREHVDVKETVTVIRTNVEIKLLNQKQSLMTVVLSVQQRKDKLEEKVDNMSKQLNEVQKSVELFF